MFIIHTQMLLLTLIRDDFLCNDRLLVKDTGLQDTESNYLLSAEPYAGHLYYSLSVSGNIL